VDFVNQENTPEGNGLSSEQMLSDDYDFDARMDIDTGDGVFSVSVRDMIAAGAFRYWLYGPKATQVIVEDRDTEPQFDLGTGQKSFHPIFVATFYPGWRGVKVELIGENAWMNKFQDINYAVNLRVGRELKTVYTKDRFTHFAGTRWRKTFWSGQEPSRADIDYNLPYMVYSGVIPNFDLSKKVPGDIVREEIRAFERTDRGDINGSGQWLKYFPNTGGRADIGLFPRWAVRYLYTFDSGLYDVMIANAEVSGHIPIHFRESSGDRLFYGTGEDNSATGRVVSIDSRPKFISRDLSKGFPPDRIQLSGTLGRSGWTVDLAHQPSFAFVPYLVSGDWYFLEELYFWAAYNVASADFGKCSWCRGGDTWGFIHDQVRGKAWGVRTLGHAAFAAPDGSVEEKYFTDKLLNNIAVWEGRLDIRDGIFFDSDRMEQWKWGREVPDPDAPNPLHFVEYRKDANITPAMAGDFDSSKTLNVTPPWTAYFNYIVWGHLEELGFPFGPLRRTAAKNLLHQLLDPDYNPYLSGVYFMPLGPSPGRYFQNWAEVRSGFSDRLRNATGWVTGVGDVEHGYPYITYAAAAFLNDVNDGGLRGTDAWQWISHNLPMQSRLNDNPKWAILPRPTEETSDYYRNAWAQNFKRSKKDSRPGARDTSTLGRH
jgi:hypothetical protein